MYVEFLEDMDTVWSNGNFHYLLLLLLLLQGGKARRSWPTVNATFFSFRDQISHSYTHKERENPECTECILYICIISFRFETWVHDMACYSIKKKKPTQKNNSQNKILTYVLELK